MRPNKFSMDQIIRIIAETDPPTNSISSVARKYGTAANTIYRWRQKYKGLNASKAKCLKVLDEENLRLKGILAEKELEIQAVTDIIKKISEEERPENACGPNT